MLGGGSFTVQNKILPGAYINFVSAASSVAVLSDRGTAAIPLEFGWGPEKEAFIAVSYTHLDVYKRQPIHYPLSGTDWMIMRYQTSKEAAYRS